MILTKDQIEKFEEASRPLMKFMAEFHPHVQAVVDSGSAEFLESSCRVKTEDYIRD